MRTRIRVYAAVFATVVLGMLVAGTAVAAAHGKDKGKTLRVVAETIQSEFIDPQGTGPSLGDQLVFSERLFVRGEEVGESGGVCTVTKASPPYDVVSFHCVATLDLGRGQVTLQGLIEVQGEDDFGPFTVAITGGTGKFRGASGEAVVRILSDERSVYKLRFDKKKHDNHKKKNHKHSGKKRPSV